MISPTLIMETELDTDDDDDDDDTANIYEEVLNDENYQNKQFHGRLSTTSSGDYSRSSQYQVRYKHQHNLLKSNFSFESISPNQWRKGG